MSSTNEAAKRLFITPRHFRRLQHDGILPKFAPNDVDLDLCCEMYLKHLQKSAAGRQERQPAKGDGKGLVLEQERAKLAKVQAEKIELELRQRRGKLVDVDEVGQVLAVMDIAIRDRLLAVPMAAADRALEASLTLGAAGIAEIYRVEINAALEALASAEIVAKKAA
jgi:hypothetical protein